VDGLPKISTAVVGYSLYQEHSTSFALEGDIASGLPDLTATDFLEKKCGTDPLSGKRAPALRQRHH
jgi:type VI secretion system secreted protein VgrG